MVIQTLRIISFLLLLSSCGMKPSVNETKAIEKTSSSPFTFIPADFELLDSISGNINGDSLNDLLMICRPIGEDTLSIDEDSILKRVMLLLTGAKSNTYTLAAKSENAVYCYSCGGMYGDPYAGLEINGQSFTISHYGGAAERWTRSLTFSYDPNLNDWLLVRDESEVFDALNTDSIESEVKTPADFGKLRFSDFNIYN